MTAPESWTCPTHNVEYGNGKPDPLGCKLECPECMKALSELTREHSARHVRYRWWRTNSGVSARYRAVRPTHIKPLSPSAETLGAAVRAYTGDLAAKLQSGEGLVLLGPPGLGKTLALSALVNAACQKIHGPRYAVWPDALADLKASFSGGRDDPRKQAVERLHDCPLLALDELGIKAASEYDHNELFRLVDYRYREGLPTLVAANCTRSNFAQIVGERIADRLFEQGPVIVLTGESQRGKVAIEADPYPEPPQTVTTEVHCMGKWTTRRIEAREVR